MAISSRTPLGSRYAICHVRVMAPAAIIQDPPQNQPSSSTTPPPPLYTTTYLPPRPDK